MAGINYQKVVYSRWQGYTNDPNIKTVMLNHKKLREYITEDGPGKKILDLGCADGILSAPLVKDYDVYGVELEEHLAKDAVRKGIKVSVVDLEEGIPFTSQTFDIVVASEIIEHIANTDFFLSECNRVLKMGGKIILTAPNINNLFSPFILLFFDYPPPGSSRYRSPHVRDFTFSLLKIALLNNYFIIEKRRGLAFYIPFVRKMLKIRSFLADIFPRSSDKYIVKAKKEKEMVYDEGLVVENSSPRFMLNKIFFRKRFSK